MYDAAEHGCQGSTHAEIIKDWQEAWKCYMSDSLDMDNEEDEKLYDRILEEISSVEKWHEDNGSLFTQVG
jgi:hypothetical protein